MRRGDIYLVTFDPVRASEADKERPAVIVSNDAANRAAESTGRGVVTVVPVTTNLSRVYPFQVMLEAAEVGIRQDSKAQAEQVRAVSVHRLRRRIGQLPTPALGRLDDALRLHLAL